MNSALKLICRVSDINHIRMIDTFQTNINIYIVFFYFFSEDPLPPHFYESVENRRNWLSCLEFSYTDRFGGSINEDLEDYTGEDSLWMRLFPRLSPSPRLTELIRGLEDKEHRVERPQWSGRSRIGISLKP